ncbi:hypothetical protein OIE69_07240 [Actinacidiphila glaucinigra]|uniref:hypothetical protein n=1 Tax=Actinacidiphila glaucinigra TaxID=235986 RepID=UPI002DD8AC34|nr:hypothetical protein [Actinacidiphila glaucinigra]WSD58718.1 hypothetical protein OIE69_07240 [Actinacidiphila glaucinigra]
MTAPTPFRDPGRAGYPLSRGLRTRAGARRSAGPRKDAVAPPHAPVGTIREEPA